MRRVLLPVIGGMLGARPATAAAQARIDDATSVRVAVNDETERYLRALEVRGLTKLEPWSIRAFSPIQLQRLVATDSAHPWRGRLAPSPLTAPGPGVRWELLAPETRLVFNSRFPYGFNDGAVWAGRGLTTAVQGGIGLRYGVLTAVVEPIVFRAENGDFPLAANGRSGRLVFADPRYAGTIDLPQRFGDGAYQRFDPGQSTIRVDYRGAALGISTANQHWGPAIAHPLLLGNNAAGYAHLFVGTSRPVGVGIGSVHGRLVWGRLEQSAYGVLEGRQSRRFSAGAVGVFQPRGAPGLEIGAARFFHILWPEGGPELGDFLLPLSGLTEVARARETGGSGIEPDNQLASVFLRWAFPASGFEMYAEYARDDRNYDARDLIVEPDHDAGYLLGFQKVWRNSPTTLTALRAELLDTRITHLQLSRAEAPFYVHGSALQGHTQRGQVLGSAGAFGGGAALVAFDRWTPRGRWTVSWTRLMRGERFGTSNLPQPLEADVAHALGVEALWLRRGLDLTAGLTGVHEYNRDFAGDASNVNLTFGARAHW